MHYTSKQRKQVLERINNLSATEHEEIFNIIQRTSDNIQFTSNKNGVFFNLSALPDTVVKEIDDFIQFCYSNKQELDDYDKKLNECKVNANIINLDLETIVEKKPLNNGKGKQASALPICDWATLNLEQTVDTKHTQKIINFIERLHSDKSTKKKINIKFHNAKKKYSKKVLMDTKFEFDNYDDLQPEDFLLKA